jgi:hypothetical protein
MPIIRSLVDYFRKSSGVGSNSDSIDPIADPECWPAYSFCDKSRIQGVRAWLQ